MAEMSPPRPTLDWSKASHYSFLDDFKLLYDTHHNIHSKPWADPVIQSMMKQASHIKHAKEEINNCNIDIRHLFTHVLDENCDLRALVGKLEKDSDAIVGAVNEYLIHRSQENAFILSHIFDTFDLTGHSRETKPGIRIGQTSPPYSAAECLQAKQDGSGDENELDDEDADDRHGLIEYMNELSVK